MKPERNTSKLWATSTLNRRAAVAGTAASAIATATHVATAQGTPEATALVSGDLDSGRVMMVSTNLCGGANLKQENAGVLLEILNGNPEFAAPFEELEAVAEFTEDAMADVTPEAQTLAANILQYWFLGRFDGEPIEGRADLYFDLACWQALPYSTAPSTCKSFGYWAVEIEL